MAPARLSVPLLPACCAWQCSGRQTPCAAIETSLVQRLRRCMRPAVGWGGEWTGQTVGGVGRPADAPMCPCISHPTPPHPNPSVPHTLRPGGPASAAVRRLVPASRRDTNARCCGGMWARMSWRYAASQEQRSCWMPRAAQGGAGVVSQQVYQGRQGPASWHSPGCSAAAAPAERSRSQAAPLCSTHNEGPAHLHPAQARCWTAPQSRRTAAAAARGWQEMLALTLAGQRRQCSMQSGSARCPGRGITAAAGAKRIPHRWVWHASLKC